MDGWAMWPIDPKFCDTSKVLNCHFYLWTYIYKFQASSKWCKEECRHHPQVNLSGTNKLSHTGLIHMHKKTNKKTEIVVDWYSHISGQPYMYTQGMPPPGRFCTLVHAEKYLNGEFKKKKKGKYFLITKCVTTGTCMQVKWNFYWTIFTHFRPALYARNAPSR